VARAVLETVDLRNLRTLFGLMIEGVVAAVMAVVAIGVVVESLVSVAVPVLVAARRVRIMGTNGGGGIIIGLTGMGAAAATGAGAPVTDAMAGPMA
jgi:hypothetical protein